MKMFEKIRDLFTEEVEVDTPVKKEVIQVEIPAPAPKKEEIKKEVEIKKVEEPTKEIPKQDDKFNFPVFFDEKDFDDIQKKEEVKVEKKEYKREAYGVKKEIPKEPQRFAPTPIISPVYGVLDKNYKKDDIVDKPKKVSNYKVDTNMTIDDVRNKAYGTLEDELESTLFGKTSIMLAKEDETETYDSIEDDLKDTAEALDLLCEDPVTNEEVEHKEEEKVNTKTDAESLDDILNSKYENDNMVEDALNDDFTNDEKLSESDLFNLIDNMYEKGDK